MGVRSLVARGAAAVLLLGAGVLTLNRLVEPSAGRWVRLEAFTPFALLPYAAALVVLLVLVWRRRTPLVLVGLVLAVAGLGLHGWWVAPMVSGANPPAPSDARTLRVMTANVYAGQVDGISLVEAVAEEDVDVLVLEEVTAGLLATMDSAGLGELLPYRIGDPGDGAEGTMVLARDPLGQPTPLATTWDGWQVDVAGLTLLAVHPISPVDVAGWREDHAEVLSVATSVDADLVVGDLNATIDHPPMRDLADAGFRSVSELANEGWQPTWPAYGVVEVLGIPLPRLVQIDHVLVGSRLAAVNAHAVGLPGTDHRALVAEVAVK